MARYLCIACEVLARPLYHIAATSPNAIDIVLMKRSLHDEPSKMRAKLQKKIDFSEERGYEAVLMGYGLCGNGTIGLQARTVPLVIPRVHDCITLLLGDAQRYHQEFDQNPGTYWYSQDFLERADETGKFNTLGPINDEELSKQYEVFLQQYGRDNADYLMETLGTWQKKYQRAAYIDAGIVPLDGLAELTKVEAAQRGWAFETLAGDLLLLRELLNGGWLKKTSKSFIVIPPQHSVDVTYDKQIFRCTPG